MKQKNIVAPALGSIRVTDPLFAHYVAIVADKLIPYQWEVLNDRVEGIEKSCCVRNFRVAAGELPGIHEGMVFSDTDVYKWLETLAFCLEQGKAQAFEEQADELIALIGRAQEADGYLNTYFSVNCPERKWTDFAEGHELYSAGHLLEAAVAYTRATGKTALLHIACRFADLITEKFRPDGPLANACPGHQEIELALMKLYRLTGEKRYAETARHFLSVRGNSSGFLMDNLRRQGKDRIFPEFADYDEKYAQSHCPPVEQTTAEGHAVRAMYMFSAMADVAAEFGDEAMADACFRLWKNVTEKRMYITGGIGSSGHLERFTADYDLPNDSMYCESCASVGLMMFGQRMAALTGNAAYCDAVERALCNTVLAGISAEGDRYFYVNPLEVWPENCLPSTSMAHVKSVRQPWFGCACCPPNIARTLASLGQYIYAQDARSIYINQLISSSLHTEVRGTSASLELASSILKDGKASVTVVSDGRQPFTLRIRIPPYLKDPVFSLCGKQIAPVIEKGYAVVAISQEGKQNLEISGSVQPCWVAANRNVRADAGKIALMFGPYVYCLEETDNGSGLPFVFVSPSAPVRQEAPAEGLPGSLPVLAFAGKHLSSGIETELYASPAFSFTDAELKAVPYALWCNRTPGEMAVWLRALLPDPGKTEV